MHFSAAILLSTCLLCFLFVNGSFSLADSAGSTNLYKMGGCLVDGLKPRVCDPEAILSDDQLEQLNGQLAELEKATNTEFYPSPPMWEFLHASNCPSSGLTVSLVLFRHLDSLKIAAKELADFHWRWSLAHPCAKTAVALINLEGVGSEQQHVDLFSVSGALNRQPILVGSKFFGISSENTDLAPVELAQAFYNQLLGRKRAMPGELAETLGGMIDKLRSSMMLRM